MIETSLVDDWARPIFGVTSNFKSLSREEREERDYQNMSKKRRLRYSIVALSMNT